MKVPKRGNEIPRVTKVSISADFKLAISIYTYD